MWDFTILTALNMTDMAARRFSSLSNGESASCIFRKCFEITARTAADGTLVDSCETNKHFVEHLLGEKFYIVFGIIIKLYWCLRVAVFIVTEYTLHRNYTDYYNFTNTIYWFFNITSNGNQCSMQAQPYLHGQKEYRIFETMYRKNLLQK